MVVLRVTCGAPWSLPSRAGKNVCWAKWLLLRRSNTETHEHRSRLHADVECASLAIAGGMPIEVAQQNLGHASLATTTVYVKTEEKRRMKAVKKFWEARAGR